MATVNNEDISKEEFQKYLEMKPTVRVKMPDGQVRDAEVSGSIGLQAIADLVNQKLIMQIARDEGVSPNDGDIQKEIDFRTKINPQFLKMLTSQGLTIDQIRKSLMVEIARDHIITKGINVTPDEVDKYIKDNPEQFRKPEMADLKWVVVPTEDDKKKVDQDLAAGTDFGAVAARYSVADNARSLQGVFPQRVIDELPIQIKDIVKSTAELKSTDWVRITEGWAKWYVQKKYPAEDEKIDDVMKERVKRRIMTDRGLRANDLDKRLAEKLRTSKIDVSDPIYKQPFEKEIQSIRESYSLKYGDNAAGK
ncbi:MAG: SurA N-terminal domain-containing protein [Armatimonadetes bacterium]|nr:SurA N-terminal domain-containing protein [Armatimonadota bacterium]